MSFQRSFALLLLGLASANGQEPVEATPTPIAPPSVPLAPTTPNVPAPRTAPGAAVPGVVPPPAAGAPAPAIQPAPRAGIPLGDTKIVTDINEPKLSGNALAGLYRKYTGRRVVVAAAASTAEFSFVQEATPQDPLTFKEAAELLKIAATIENFIFVPHPNNPDIDVLTLATGGVRPPGIGLEVVNENDPLPEGDAVISYVMNLSYIKPQEAVNTFTQIIGQFGAYGSIAPVTNASAIVITENTSLIRKLIDLKKEIDKPSSQVDTRFISVRYADVTEIATTLTELLTAQQTAQTTAGIQRTDSAPQPQGGNPAVNQAGAQAGGGGSAEAAPVQVIPDPRTNRIFAMGRPVDLLFVEGLVREFDVETSEKNFLRRKLRFLTVSDFLPIAGDALTRAFSGSADGGGGGGAAAAGGRGGAAAGGSNRGAQASGGNTRQAGGRSGSTGANFGGGGSGSFGGGAAGGSGASGGGGSGLGDPDVNSAPESVLVGRTLLVADNITNSIVVQGPPSGLEIIERLLDQIDVKPAQVMISTVIGQMSLTDGQDLGVDYLYRGGDMVGRGGAGFGPVLPILPIPGVGDEPGVADFNPGTLNGSGLRLYGKIGNNLNIYLRALQEKTDFTVLSRPSIFTSNNQKGTISSGERIAIPTSSNSFSSGGSSTNIEYQDVVLKLEIIPLINSEKEITMQIALLNDERGADQVIEGAGNDGAPLTVPGITTREILTTATVPNNETVVLGGLIVTRDRETKSGIPILSSIPYVGGLFGTTSKNKARSDLMVFIQPSIISNERSLDDIQIDMDSRYKVAPAARGMSDGPGVLPTAGSIQTTDDKLGSRVYAPATDIQMMPSSTKRKITFGPGNRR